MKNYLVSARIVLPVLDVANKDEAENLIRNTFRAFSPKLNLDIYAVDDFDDITIEDESEKKQEEIHKI